MVTFSSRQWVGAAVVAAALALATTTVLAVEEFAQEVFDVSRDNAVPIKDWKLVEASSHYKSDSTLTARKPEHAFDGSAVTHWHSDWQKDHPHYIVVDMGREYSVSGLRYLPRQDGQPNGDLQRCALYISNDPKMFVVPAVITNLPETKRPVEVKFSPRSGRYFMFRSLSEHSGKHRACVAEIVLIQE